MSNYLCPFCVSSSICHGPHIQSEDLEKFRYLVKIIQEDLAELAKEIILEHGVNMDLQVLARFVEQRLKDRDNI